MAPTVLPRTVHESRELQKWMVAFAANQRLGQARLSPAAIRANGAIRRRLPHGMADVSAESSMEWSGVPGAAA